MAKSEVQKRPEIHTLAFPSMALTYAVQWAQADSSDPICGLEKSIGTYVGESSLGMLPMIRRRKVGNFLAITINSGLARPPRARAVSTRGYVSPSFQGI